MVKITGERGIIAVLLLIIVALVIYIVIMKGKRAKGGRKLELSAEEYKKMYEFVTNSWKSWRSEKRRTRHLDRTFELSYPDKNLNWMRTSFYNGKPASFALGKADGEGGDEYVLDAAPKLEKEVRDEDDAKLDKHKNKMFRENNFIPPEELFPELKRK